MKSESFIYTKAAGWSVDAFPDLDGAQTLVVVFGAPGYLDDPAPLAALAAAYPQANITGCSTSGEIHGATILDESLSVAVLQFKHTRLAMATAPVQSAADSFAAGESLARQLDDSALRALFVLSDGINVNGSELVGGLNSVLSEDVVVTGGLAGDGDRFERTWILRDGRPRVDMVSAVAFYGDALTISHGSNHGWEIFGPERLVTRSQGNVLYELDGQPALQLYKEYLGDRAAELPASALRFPLAVRASREDDNQVVRTILSIDEDAQSMTFAGDIPQGYQAQLMKASFYGLIDGAAAAASMANQAAPRGDHTVSIAISCVGRRLVLGEYTEDELDAALENLPAGARQIGFYSYGEISPHAPGYCDLHNQTMTLTTISEE